MAYHTDNPEVNPLREEETQLSPDTDAEELNLGKAKLEIVQPEGEKPTKCYLSRTWCVAVVLLVIALLALIVVGIYYLVMQPSNTGLGSYSSPVESCLQLQQNENRTTGYYYMLSYASDEPFLVFCDMDANGGGWTLVASVYENDVKKKCAPDDLWFSRNGSNVPRNWENRNIFGYVEDATRDDYKNSGYFLMNASNIMIRHMLNRKSLLDTDGSLDYFTDNHFLKDNGGNLYSLFTDHYPLTPDNSHETVYGASVVDDMLDLLVNNSHDIFTVNVFNFYNYVYDDEEPDRLTNGGSRLFLIFGMKVSVTTPFCNWSLEYGKTYNCDKDQTKLSSRKSNPFFALMDIGSVSKEKSPQYFVVSIRPPTDRTYDYFNSFTNGSCGMDYYAACRFNSDIPSYCDMMFTFYNRELWKSRSLFTESEKSNLKGVATYNNSIYGYTMVARDPTKTDLSIFPHEEIMRHVFNVLLRYPDKNIENMLDGLVANSNYIVSTEPPVYLAYSLDEASSAAGSNLSLGRVYTTLRNYSNLWAFEYGKTYNLPEEHVELSSREAWPFFTLMKTERIDYDLSARYLVLNRSEDCLSYHCINAKRYPGPAIQFGNYVINYDAVCRKFTAVLPTVCDVGFSISNKEDWGTSGSSIFGSKLWNNLQNYTVQISHKLSNGVAGYLFLAREPGEQNNDLHLAEIMENILILISKNFPSITPNCAKPSFHLAVPVVNNGILTVPGELDKYITYGYLQFRARSYTGAAYALCPGVRVETCESQNVCIGGVSGDRNKTNDCSDYLDWKHRSRYNLESVTLIFYR